MKGRTFWSRPGFFSTSILSQNSEKIEGGTFGEKVFPEKSLAMQNKTERWDLLVSSGIVCYAGSLFGSIPRANAYNLASS